MTCYGKNDAEQATYLNAVPAVTDKNVRLLRPWLTVPGVYGQRDGPGIAASTCPERSV